MTAVLPKFDTQPSVQLRCTSCYLRRWSSTDSARVAGWRIWTGTTLGGKQDKQVLCPMCAGSVTEALGARCNLCDTSTSDCDEDDGPHTWTAAELRQWARDHECEPTFTIAAGSKVLGELQP